MHRRSAPPLMSQAHNPHATPLVRSVVIAPVLVLCVLASGLAWQSFDRGPVAPGRWDPRVEPYVETVEQLRGLEFIHPVPVYFLSPSEYSNLVRNGSILASEPPDVDRALGDGEQRDIDTDAAVARSLGLLEGAPDLREANEDLADTGSLAHYDPLLEVVNVRGREVDTDLAVTLVHELTHALQDQHFDLDRIGELESEDEYSAFRALVEGDAVSIEREYLASLPEGEQQDYVDRARRGAEEVRETLADVPSVLQSTLAFYYVVGSPFVDLVAATPTGPRDNAAVDAAFDNPPSSSQQLIHGPSYAADEDPVEVAAPDAPGDTEALRTESLGAAYLFIMLSERIDGADALHAVDGIAGDTFVTYETGDDVCVRGRIEAFDVDAAEALEAAGSDWANRMPAGARASVDRSGTSVRIVTCDPGADADAGLTGRSERAILYPATRLDVAAQGVGAGSNGDTAWCYADTVVRGLGPDQLAGDGTGAEVKELLRTAARSCGL